MGPQGACVEVSFILGARVTLVPLQEEEHETFVAHPDFNLSNVSHHVGLNQELRNALLIEAL